MKKLISQLILIPTLLALLMVTGCGQLDDFTLDDMNPFVKEKADTSPPLRRYELPEDSPTPLVVFIANEKSKIGTDYSANIRKTCDYTKIPFREISVTDFNANPKPLATTRVIVVPETKKLSNAAIDQLIEFAAAGGTVFMPYVEDDTRLAFLLGFKTDAEYNTDITSKGFKFKVPMVTNFAGKTYQEDMKHYGFSAANFGPNVKILATAVDNPAYPAIVENPIGKGRALVFNTAISLSKIDRGLMFAGILKGLEGVPYPIANTATIFLDDFPSPLYNIKAEPIKSEMDLTITDFVYKVWWPDMVDLAKKYRMSYAAMIAFDYKNKVEPPFIFDQWNENKIRTEKKVEPVSDWLVYNVKNTGHELAFHGYNHVSLQKGLWPNGQFVGMALKAVDKKWEINNFGAKPVTYVPPSNIIDGEGVNQLKAGMPSLKYMCSLYLGDLSDGGGREFDFDPYNENMFDYPRISSGFYMDDQTQYAHESMWLYTGIWTHFVHPDDVYQIPEGYNKASQGKDALRNSKNLGWRKTPGTNNSMLGEFDRYLKMVTTAYPQTRFLNGAQAGPIVNDWRAARFSHINRDGRYTVTRTDSGLSDTQYWLVFASQQNAGKVENSLRAESHLFSKTPLADGYIYSVYTNKPELTLRDLMYKDREALALTAKLVRKVTSQYKNFKAQVGQFHAGTGVWEDNSEKLRQKEMADLLKRMTSETQIDTAAWNQYTRFLSWDDRADEVWKLYEEHCLKNPSKENILYHKELAKLVYYPNELTREKWMSAQMMVTPNDKDLLNSYVADYYTPENQAKIREALVNLLKVDTSFESYLKYIEYLLVYDQQEALKELEDKKPVIEFQPFATDAVWLFANNGLYAKAYEWSALSGEIDFTSRMYWLQELKDWKLIESEYKKHIVQNPNDTKAKAMMAGIYQQTGRFRDAWVLTNSMTESPDKDLLRTELNKYVIWEKPEIQQDLLDNHADLFLPEVLRKLSRTIRKETSDFVAARSETETNRDDIRAFKNVLTYNHYDKKGNLHTFGGTYSTMYKILLLPTKDFADNHTHALGGLEYQFTNPKEKKFQYWFRGRAEYSDRKKLFYQFGSGISQSKDKEYRSATLRIFPAETGPAHSKSIYQMQLNLYYDFYAFSLFNISISLEGDYYTKAVTESMYTIDESIEGFATGRLIWDNGKPRRSKFLPFLEAGMSQASVGRAFVNPSSGYPYWMLDHRFNAGGGLGWKYGLPESDLTAELEIGVFYDDYSDDFQRYSGEVAWQIFDFTQITAAVQVFGQDKFFSNNVVLGVKHNLKKRNRKK